MFVYVFMWYVCVGVSYICVFVSYVYACLWALLKSGYVHFMYFYVYVFLYACLMEALGHLLAKISTYAYACVVCIYVF